MERMGRGHHGEFSEGRLSALESHGGVVMVMVVMVIVGTLKGGPSLGMKEDEWNSFHVLNLLYVRSPLHVGLRGIKSPELCIK